MIISPEGFVYLIIFALASLAIVTAQPGRWF